MAECKYPLLLPAMFRVYKLERYELLRNNQSRLGFAISPESTSIVRVEDLYNVSVIVLYSFQCQS